MRALVALPITALLSFGASVPLLLGRDDSQEALLLTGAALLLYIAIPYLLITRLYKEDASAYGWRLPVPVGRALALSLIVFLPHAALAYLLAGHADFKEFYASHLSLILVALSALYYLAEEFLFRGYLFFALRARSVILAYLLTSALFALLHAGKPPLEMAFAFLSSLLLCWLSEKTRSFLPAALVHFAVALFLNVLIYVTPS